MNRILITLILFFGILSNSWSQLSFSFSTTQPTCYNYNNGTINLTVSGGTLPYSISWYHNGGLISTQEDLNGLSDGQYVVQAIDSAGLTLVDTVALNALYQITTVDTITNALCYSATGTINITPQNGFGFYQGIMYPLLWDAYFQIWKIDSARVDTMITNIDTTNFVWSVVAGRYQIVVTDNSGLGCAISKIVDIHQPSSPVSLNKTYFHNICKGDSAGWVNIMPDGGTPPYTYAWSNGLTTSQNNFLKVGLYTVTVRDFNSCPRIETIGIEEPFQSLMLIADSQDVSCRDNHDGFLGILNIENGLSPFTYLWSNGSTDTKISDLDSGKYSITVTDSKGCYITRNFHVGMKDCDCITIYNVVTPDGNGKNDKWEIKNIHLYPNAEVKVFNRWGKLVYTKSNGYDNSWDGKFEGSLLDSGDYYYVVNLNLGNYPPYTGPVKILK
jgi:gliding motility-associated-like protein